MVTHIVLWNFKETMSADEKREAALKMKEILEPLKEQIPGVLSLKVVTDKLSGSSMDVALIGEYESEQALNTYAVHPLHLEAKKYINLVTESRECFDF